MKLPYLSFDCEDIVPLQNNVYTMSSEYFYSNFQFSECAYLNTSYSESFAIVLTAYGTRSKIIALCDIITFEETSVLFRVFGRGLLTKLNKKHVYFNPYFYKDLPPLYENNIESILTLYKNLKLYSDIDFSTLPFTLASLDYLAEKVFAESEDKMFYFESNNIKASICLFYECYMLLTSLLAPKKNTSYPKLVLEKIEKEKSLQSYYLQGSQEFAKIQEYLDLIVELPWSNYSDPSLDYFKVAQAINSSHYGLLPTKNKILDIIAYEILSKTNVSTSLLFLGPPGTGKTTFAKSLAKTLSRDYIYIPVGSMSDDTELKGHRRTYVGAKPGYIVQTLASSCTTSNPLIVLDEIDKVKDFKSSITTILLELLDFEQNKNFKDRFLELPLDLSKCLFICTANTTELMSKPLLDRLTFIEFPEYSIQEKVSIVNDYMLPSLSDFTEPDLPINNFSQKLIFHLANVYSLREIKSLLSMLLRRNCRSHIDSKIQPIFTLKDFLSSDLTINKNRKKIGF